MISTTSASRARQDLGNATTPLLLIALMLAAGAVLGRPSIVFPEYGALVVGSLVHRLPLWRARVADIVVMPSLAAVAAVSLNATSLPMWCKETSMLVGVMVVLRLSRSAMVPTLSAGLLPLLLGFRGPTFPWAVLVTCTVLAAVVHLDKRRSTPRGLAPARITVPVPGAGLLVVFAVLALVWLVFADTAHAPLLAAPPVIVAGFEVLKARGAAAFTKSFLLAFSAVVGVLCHLLLPGLWLAGLTAVIAVFFALRTASVVLPPAYAMTILPLILHHSAQLRYAVLAGAGSVCFLALIVAATRLMPATWFVPVSGAPRVPTVGAMTSTRNLASTSESAS